MSQSNLVNILPCILINKMFKNQSKMHAIVKIIGLKLLLNGMACRIGEFVRYNACIKCKGHTLDMLVL